MSCSLARLSRKKPLARGQMSIPRALDLYAKLRYGSEAALRRAYRLVQRIDPEEDDFLALFHLAIHGLTFPRARKVRDGDIRRAVRELGGLYNVGAADVVRRLGYAVDERRVRRVFDRMHDENRRRRYADAERPKRVIRVLRKDRAEKSTDQRWRAAPNPDWLDEVRAHRWLELERAAGELDLGWLEEVRDHRWFELERMHVEQRKVEQRARRFGATTAARVPSVSLLDLPLPTSRQDAEEDPGVDDTEIFRATESQDRAYRERLDRELDDYMAERRRI